MRWVTFRPAPDAEDRVGLLLGDAVHALPAGERLLDLLGDDGEGLARAGEQAARDPAEVRPLREVRLRPPISRPPSFRDFYAFEQHVRTARQSRGLPMEPDWYQLPVFYLSNPAAFVGDGDEVAVPPGCEHLDFELEVAAILGRGGINLSPAQAEAQIAGFAILNDWSARDLQVREMKLGLGPAKAKDFASSLGPMLVTPDELADRRRGAAYDLTMTAAVNGREFSRGNLADLYWSFGEMIAYASRGAPMEAGAVVGSGTCGTGCILELSLVHGSDAYPWLRHGDEVALRVERLGTLTNRVIPGSPLVPLRAATG
jgi:2-keto-4-pentenoate hydratase/2-oxohepta-3-ene-1,7-dioic acid hydratase in catechol pathway